MLTPVEGKILVQLLDTWWLHLDQEGSFETMLKLRETAPPPLYFWNSKIVMKLTVLQSIHARVLPRKIFTGCSNIHENNQPFQFY